MMSLHFAWVLSISLFLAGGAQAVSHVIHVSVDGLHADAAALLGATRAPAFDRLTREGASTRNARTDALRANTLTNHASMLTGRGVAGPDGHEWDNNADTDDPVTLHTNKGSYVSSVFDVAHDAGLSTALFSSKDKFSVFERSWGVYGAPHPNGSDKIDRTLIDNDMDAMARSFVDELVTQQWDYSFVHFREPDPTGHAYDWDLDLDSAYMGAVEQVDGWLGEILDAVTSTPGLAGDTALIVTADHSGEEGFFNHVLLPPLLVVSGIVPFWVWGPGVDAGADLYALNPGSRLAPALPPADTSLPYDSDAVIPSYAAPVQPIRNADSPNLALDLLGLGPIPGSHINAAQDLGISVPEPGGLALAVVLLGIGLSRTAGRAIVCGERGRARRPTRRRSAWLRSPDPLSP